MCMQAKRTIGKKCKNAQKHTQRVYSVTFDSRSTMNSKSSDAIPIQKLVQM